MSETHTLPKCHVRGALTCGPLEFRKRSQAGMTLVVILLFMATLAVGGLFSARSALMGEQLSRNQLDIQVARQAAEAALRDAERDLMLVGPAPAGATCARGHTLSADNYTYAFTANCKAGRCTPTNNDDRLAVQYASASKNTANASKWWPSAKGGQWNDDPDTKPSPGNPGNCGVFVGAVPLGTFTGAKQIAGVAQQPEYMFEYFKRGSQIYYLITARGFGMRPGAEVVVQSYFTLPTL